jgi:hypothetical protein
LERITPAGARIYEILHHPEAFTVQTIHGVNAKTIHVSGNKMFSTREKNRRSNLDFPQLIALNVGDFILGCKFGRRTRVSFERWPETRADRIFDGQGHRPGWFWFLIIR